MSANDDDPKTLAYTVAGPQTPPPVGTHVCPSCGLELPRSIGSCPKDGTPITIHGDPGLKLVGNYEFIQFIGAGGMGVIYKAKHPVLNRLVAIKMLHGHLVTDAIIKRFRQEAEAVSSLDHRNIIHVHDYGVSEHNQPYMVMDFVEGKPLSDVLQGTALSMEAVINIAIQIAEGLQHAHDRAVLHRDLKPSNIMVTDYDCAVPEVKIVDFGIAKVLESEKTRMTQTGELIGTPQYMSPEQCRGGVLDARSDIYALGCVMFEAITGKALFSGHSMVSVIVDQMNTQPRTLQETRPDMVFPGHLEDIVAKILAKDPADRYQSMNELAQELIAVQKVIAQQKASSWSKMRVFRLNREQRNLFLLMLGSFATLATVAITSISFIKVVHDSQTTHIQRAILTNPIVGKGTTPDGKVQERRKLLPYINQEKADDELMRTFFDVDTGTTRLDIGNGKITSQSVYYISLQKSLKRLHLEKCKIYDNDLTFLPKMEKLDHLYLDGTKVTDEGLTYIAKMPTLNRLALSFTKVSDKGVERLAKTKLKWIDLSDTKISGAAMSSLGQMERLEHVTLEDYYPRGGKNLAALAGAKSLQYLNLRGGAITVEDLSEVSTIGSLTTLVLSKCSIEDGALAKLEKLDKLTELVLSECAISRSQWSEIAKLKSLKTLDLSTSSVCDQDLSVIAELMPQLECIDLKETGVTENGLLNLQKLGWLKTVELRGSAVSEKSKEALSDKLSGAKLKF
jgi:serine/threonine-protein kinase